MGHILELFVGGVVIEKFVGVSSDKVSMLYPLSPHVFKFTIQFYGNNESV